MSSCAFCVKGLHQKAPEYAEGACLCKTASLKEAEGRGLPVPSLPVTGRLGHGMGWGGIFFSCLLLPHPQLQQCRRGAPWLLAATVPFVDKRGGSSSLRPHVCAWLPVPGHVPGSLWPGCVSWPGLSGMYPCQAGRENKAVTARSF